MEENKIKKYWHYNSQPRKMQWNLSETERKGVDILFRCTQVPFFTQLLKVWILGIVKVSAKDSFPLGTGSA